MNKFSPSSTSFNDPITSKSTVDMDFDFGNLVTMTIVDVFETDARGRLLSYYTVPPLTTGPSHGTDGRGRPVPRRE